MFQAKGQESEWYQISPQLHWKLDNMKHCLKNTKVILKHKTNKNETHYWVLE